MTTTRVYLVGFMGAGKTTVARALGRRLGWRIEDVDEWVETRERATVSEIFATHGEPYFRLAEREALRRLLPLDHIVVATGGGTYADPENRSAINGTGAAVWLDLPWTAALARVPADGRRPLASNREAFEALYHARRASYQQAHLRLDATAPVDELVERILDWLGY
jgi:shikimate kinase